MNDAPRTAAIPRARVSRWETPAVGVVLGLAAWFYFWTATTAGSPLTWERTPYDLYNRLAEGFLAGRTSFVEEPPPELAKLANPYDPAQNAPYRRFHDVTYYQGRYYLYFGPGPVLFLLAPWKLVTGSWLPQNLAALAFGWGVALMGVVVLREARARWFPAAPAWLVVSAAAVLCFGNLVPLLLRRPIYYEVAVASGAFFGLLTLWFFLRATAATGRKRAWLVATGLGLGATVSCRPDYVLGSLFFIGVVAWSHRPADGWRAWPAWLRPWLPLALPYAACMAALMAYNHARFGSVGEFGTSYMLAGSNQLGVSQVSPRYVPINLYYYLAAAPHFSAYFPFVLVTGLPPFAAAAGYGGQENIYGFVLVVPAVWAAAGLWPVLRRGAPESALQLWGRAALGLAAGNLLFLLFLMGAANRYLVDFVPTLVVLATVGILEVHTRVAGRWRTLVGGVWLAAVAGTLGVNLALSVQHNELMKYHNPDAYAKLARRANGLAEALFGAARRAGPLRVELTFPKGRTGKLEPLLVTGWSFRADFIYVFYKDDRHVQIGFEHTSYGGALSPPVAVDFDRPHVLEFELGSLYPPAEHPYFDGKSADEVARRKRTLLVKLDGRVVLSGQYDFYDSSPGDVSVGRNPVSDAFGRRFTGVVRGVSRLAPPEPSSP